MKETPSLLGPRSYTPETACVGENNINASFILLIRIFFGLSFEFRTEMSVISLVMLSYSAALIFQSYLSAPEWPLIPKIFPKSHQAHMLITQKEHWT